MFWIKQKKEENVPKTYESRLNSIESRILKVESEILAVTIDQKIIRDKVLRKIQFKREEEEETDKIDPYRGVLIPER